MELVLEPGKFRTFYSKKPFCHFICACCKHKQYILIYSWSYFSPLLFPIHSISCDWAATRREENLLPVEGLCSAAGAELYLYYNGVRTYYKELKIYLWYELQFKQPPLSRKRIEMKLATGSTEIKHTPHSFLNYTIIMM